MAHVLTVGLSGFITLARAALYHGRAVKSPPYAYSSRLPREGGLVLAAAGT